MKYYVFGLCLLAVCWMSGFPPAAQAQGQRDRFVVVKASELADNPQRYWSRGVVFEDVVEDVSGRSKRIGDKRFIQIETEVLGRCYVDEKIIDRRGGLSEGRKYLFSGTVHSETRRTLLLFRPRTHYLVSVDAVEPLAADAKGNLLAAFSEADVDKPAFQNVQQAVVRAQNQLLAFAQNEGVDIAELFDPRSVTMDKAAEVSRVAVRAVEQELGLTSMEMLSLLVRELLVLEYAMAGEQGAPDETEVEPAVDEDRVEEPAPMEESVAEDDMEPAPQSRRFWRRDREAEEPADIPVAEEDGEALSEETVEESEPAKRRWFFGRRTVESAEEDMPDVEAVAVEPEPEDAAVEEPEVTIKEAVPFEERAVTPAPQTRKRREEAPATPVEPIPDRTGPYAPVRR